MHKYAMLIALGILAGCQTNLVSDADARAQATVASTEPLDLPADACTLAGHWSFFEAFVRSEQVRLAYTAPSARAAVSPFRITVIDNRWYYVNDGAAPTSTRLEVNSEVRNGEFHVDYVRAEFDANDELMSTNGRVGKYVFRQKEGCWRLVEGRG